jgi:hypothetical protein
MLDRASPCRGHAVDRAHRHAIHQDDALVALPHRGDVALHHQRLARAFGEHLEQRVQVRVVGAHMEDARAAIAEERLDDDVAVLARKSAMLAAVGGDQRLRHQVREVRDEQLLRRVAHAGRVVHHQRLRVDVLQDVGGRDVGHVEGRVLAHQHHVGTGAEVELLLRARG